METILLIDDDEITGRLFTTIFEHTPELKQFTPVFIQDSLNALDLIRLYGIPIVISDIVLPDKTGLDLLQDLRETEDLKNTIFIVSTVYHRIEYIRTAMQFGAFDFLLKTWDVKDLTATIIRAYNVYRERFSMQQKVHEFETIGESTSLGITISSPSGVILYANPAEALMHGYSSPSEVIGQKVSVFSQDQTYHHVPVNKKSYWERETMNRKRDGTVFPVRLVSDVIRHPTTNKVISIVTTCEDLTEQNNMKSQLRQTIEHFSFGYHVIQSISRKLSYIDVIQALLSSLVNFSAISGSALVLLGDDAPQIYYHPRKKSFQPGQIQELVKTARTIDTSFLSKPCQYDCPVSGLTQFVAIKLLLEINVTQGALFVFAKNPIPQTFFDALILIRDQVTTAIQQAWITQQYKELAELSNLAIKQQTERFSVPLHE